MHYKIGNHHKLHIIESYAISSMVYSSKSMIYSSQSDVFLEYTPQNNRQYESPMINAWINPPNVAIFLVLYIQFDLSNFIIFTVLMH